MKSINVQEGEGITAEVFLQLLFVIGNQQYHTVSNPAPVPKKSILCEFAVF